jgi:hypothetical protein
MCLSKCIRLYFISLSVLDYTLDLLLSVLDYTLCLLGSVLDYTYVS